MVRGALFVSVFLSNGLMWANFTKALTKSKSSAEASGVTKGMNFLWTVSFNEGFCFIKVSGTIRGCFLWGTPNNALGNWRFSNYHWNLLH
jgi:hypothetical protein